ncbi:hypothetical protein [Caudoviricetes sp.]|nr:hypothetical protein [Caudoviricetes sp.]
MLRGQPARVWGDSAAGLLETVFAKAVQGDGDRLQQFNFHQPSARSRRSRFSGVKKQGGR